jgi:hypothetical protein
MAGAAGTLIDRIRLRRSGAVRPQRSDRAGGPGLLRLDRLLAAAVALRPATDRPAPAADPWPHRGPDPSPHDRLRPGTDWAWRPQAWAARLALPGLAAAASGSGFGERVRLFHDGDEVELALWQRANARGTGLPPCAVEVEAGRFAGRFLALAIDLPQAAARGLGPAKLIRVDLAVAGEPPPVLYARLNLCQGPNVTPLLRQVAAGGRQAAVFDLAYAALEPAPVDRLWLDLILEAPAMTRIAFLDLALCRHPRAPL